jgi:hypothetical protein
MQFTKSLRNWIYSKFLHFAVIFIENMEKLASLEKGFPLRRYEIGPPAQQGRWTKKAFSNRREQSGTFISELREA